MFRIRLGYGHRVDNVLIMPELQPQGTFYTWGWGATYGTAVCVAPGIKTHGL